MIRLLVIIAAVFGALYLLKPTRISEEPGNRDRGPGPGPGQDGGDETSCA
jgi:hypothetical protein